MIGAIIGGAVGALGGLLGSAGKNELSDAVQFTGNTTFNADVPNGLYKVRVTLGNTARTSVYMENMLQQNIVDYY